MLSKRKLLWLYHRWLKHRLGSCGESVIFNGWIRITNPKNVFVGNNVCVGDNTFIDSVGKVIIKDNIRLGANLRCIAHNHNIEGDMLPFDNRLIARPVFIEDNVFVGRDVLILGGSVLSEGCVVGAGCVVSGMINPLDVVVSAPLRVVRKRDEVLYNVLVSGEQFIKPGTGFVKMSED